MRWLVIILSILPLPAMAEEAPRNPFMPGFLQETIARPAPSDHTEPLHQKALAAAPLKQFFVIGMMTTPKHQIAAVKGPDGRVHIVEVGYTLGKEHAKITAITAEGVTIDHRGTEQILAIQHPVQEEQDATR